MNLHSGLEAIVAGPKSAAVVEGLGFVGYGVKERMVQMLIISLKIVVGKMRRKLPMFMRKEKALHMALTANLSEMS